MLSILLLLVLVGVAMALIHQYVPSPFSWILLVVCGIVVLLLVLEAAGAGRVLGSLRG